MTEGQLIRMLTESGAGAKTPDLCRKHWIPDATFYNRKGSCGGKTVSDAGRSKTPRGREQQAEELAGRVVDGQAGIEGPAVA